jgi:cyanophycinase
MNPESLGNGLGEDTGLMIKGDIGECIGSGTVVMIDGDEISQTNVINAGTDTPLFIENLKVHLLCEGCRFSISKRALLNPAVKKNAHANKAKN